MVIETSSGGAGVAMVYESVVLAHECVWRKLAGDSNSQIAEAMRWVYKYGDEFFMTTAARAVANQLMRQLKQRMTTSKSERKGVLK